MPSPKKFRLEIASPCGASWRDMEGDDRVRFCTECKLNVYNLSSMTADEALALVEEREGRLCVHFYQREDGSVLTSDCPVGKEQPVHYLGRPMRERFSVPTDEPETDEHIASDQLKLRY